MLKIQKTRVQTWFVNTLRKLSCTEKIYLQNGGVIANDSLRKLWDTKATWRNYISVDDVSQTILTKYFTGNNKVVTFRTYLFPKFIPNTFCKNCRQNFCNLSHVYYDCEESIKFWNEWRDDHKTARSNFKELSKDKSVLRHKLLVPSSQEKFSYTFGDQEVCDRDHVLRLLSLAKLYLFSCASVGMKPMYSEFKIFGNSMPNVKSSTSLKSWECNNAWMLGCPRPPREGILYSLKFQTI